MPLNDQLVIPFDDWDTFRLGLNSKYTLLVMILENIQNTTFTTQYLTESLIVRRYIVCNLTRIKDFSHAPAVI